MTQKLNLNRRQTLAGLGAGLGSAAMAGCAPGTPPVIYRGDAQVLILGAGLAGLNAARLLSDAGKDVLVLEANERVGGRVYTINHADGFTEGGGARIRVGDTRLQTIASTLGLALELADTPQDSGHFPDSATDLKISNGAQRLPEAMAKSLSRAPVLKTYIKTLSVTQDEVLAADHKGRTWRGQKMICTLPFAALRHLSIEADIPAAQKAAIARVPYVQNLQIHFRAKSPFWEKDGLKADMWQGGSLGRIIANRDASGQPTGLFRCTLYDEQINALYQDGAKGLHQRFRAELARARPSTYSNIEILEMVNWTKDNRAAGGAFISQTSNIATNVGKAIGPLHFAGSHLSKETNGMEGALESAERAVAAILA